jgi:hypothetical protein
MDTQTIVIGGVGLGAILLIMGNRSKSKTSIGADVVSSSFANNANLITGAPSIISATAQMRQTELAGNNAHDQSLYDFMATIDKNSVAKLGLNQSFASNVIAQSYTNKSDTRHVAADKEVALKSLQNEAIRDRNQYKLTRKSMGSTFDKILSFVDKRSSAVEQFAGQGQQIAGGLVSQGVSQGGQMMSSFGGGLSSTGGGVGGGSSGQSGDFMGTIMKALPMLLAVL